MYQIGVSGTVREASPTFARSLEGLGHTYFRAGDFAEYVRFFERAQEISGDIAWMDGLVADGPPQITADPRWRELERGLNHPTTDQ